MRQDGHLERGFSPAGMTPVLALPDGRHAATTMISVTKNQGLARFPFFDDALDTAHFIYFLGDLVKDAKRKVFLIVNELCVHHACLLKVWMATRKDQIVVFYLPSYSPELNPDEYLNRDLKTSIRSGPVARTANDLLGIL